MMMIQCPPDPLTGFQEPLRGMKGGNGRGAFPPLLFYNLTTRCNRRTSAAVSEFCESAYTDRALVGQSATERCEVCVEHRPVDHFRMSRQESATAYIWRYEHPANTNLA